MANIEAAFEASGLRSLEDFRKLSAVTRAQFAARADRGTHVSDHAKIERIKTESTLAKVEHELQQIEQQPKPRFANGIAQHERTRQFLEDRAAGLRRRLEQS
jgi:hypothetical protein